MQNSIRTRSTFQRTRCCSTSNHLVRPTDVWPNRIQRRWANCPTSIFRTSSITRCCRIDRSPLLCRIRLCRRTVTSCETATNRICTIHRPIWWTAFSQAKRASRITSITRTILTKRRRKRWTVLVERIHRHPHRIRVSFTFQQFFNKFLLNWVLKIST